MTTEYTVHGLRHPDGEPAHAALELRRPVRLDQQMHMISLDAEVKNPEARCAGGGQCAACGNEEMPGPEGRHGGGRSQGEMSRAVAIMGRARSVRYRAAPGGWLAAGPIAAAAPGAGAEFELLHAVRHLNWADI